MGQKEKLTLKLRSNPKTFTFDEAVTLLSYYGYEKDNKGKTSGSRVRFINRTTGARISLHKPHPRKELLDYQVSQLVDHLTEEGYL